MNKVIFLDIDGVLNLISQGHDKFGSIFHSNFTDNLKYIIDKTNAKIVISSSWRLSGLNWIKDLWLYRNLPGEIIDRTKSIYPSTKRGYEIQDWLDNNKYINYCIIDDDTDMLEHQFNNFVQTSNNYNHTDNIEGYGLTKQCSDKVIKILNRI